MQNSKTFSFLHFPSFRKNCVFCINILGLDVNHRPFISLSLFISFSPFFFSSPFRRIKTTLYRNLHRLAKKSTHKNSPLTLQTIHRTRSRSARGRAGRPLPLPLSPSLPTIPRVVGRSRERKEKETV